MILVDSSLWISWLRKKDKIPSDRMDLCICGPVLQEVIQGLKRDEAGQKVKDGLLSLIRLGDPMTTDLYLMAADIYVTGRSKGYTIRSSVDCLIAAIAMKASVPVAHRDRDFATIAKYTGLRISSL